jgi:hypothetical protein
LFVVLCTGFEFSQFEFIIGTSGGILYSVAGYLIAYVNVRGIAGTSDALIETCVFYQTILDAIFFDHTPNLMQY